jgi:DNA polymerase III subunit delta'
VTELIGNEAARAAFLAAARSDKMHHAWLFAGPQGIGKASFARWAAMTLLTERSGLDPRTVAGQMEAGVFPDYRELRRLPKDAEKAPDELARSIPIAQVRGLIPMLSTRPTHSDLRLIVIDAIDDVERPGASNALLKNLEEPPAGTVFVLISHAPGRLLPTIRSRCRLLRFEPLGMDAMTAVLRGELPEAGPEEIAALVRVGEGSPGRALGFAGLELEALDRALEAIAAEGDRSNRRRAALSKELSLKAAQPRYEAFLDRAPGLIAAHAARRHGPALREALDAYHAARELAGAARGLSLDAAATAYEMAGLVARLASP